jgi:hypothetical protein
MLGVRFEMISLCAPRRRSRLYGVSPQSSPWVRVACWLSMLSCAVTGWCARSATFSLVTSRIPHKQHNHYTR